MELIEFMQKAKDLEVLRYRQKCLIKGLEGVVEKTKKRSRAQQKTTVKSVEVRTAGTLWSYFKPTFTRDFLGLYFVIASAVTLPVLTEENAVGRFFCVFAVCVLLGFLIDVICMVKDKRVADESERKCDIQNREISEQNKKIDLYNSEVRKSFVPTFHALQMECDKANAELIQIDALREKFYDEAPFFIHPKYREFIPVCTFYDYLVTRRCEQLEGYMGAVNVYEQDLRLGAIIGRLDDIINKLDEIGMYQRAILQAVEKTNREIGNLCAKIEEQTVTQHNDMANLRNSVDLNTHYNKITAECTAVSLLMQSWRD